jgi:hypothetical protein
MTGLRDFIEKRMAAIKTEGEPLRDRRTAIMAELATINARLDAMGAEWQDLLKAAGAIGADQDQEQPRRPSSGPTIKEAILKVLLEHPNGMKAGDLLTEINTRFFDGQIERTSFSPQMSRLKNKDRKIIQRGELYFGKREGPAFAGPS